MSDTLRLGTRGSLLALTQSRWVAAQLTQQSFSVTLEIIRTTGDNITGRNFTPSDGKGVFVAEIERALLEGEIDLAVHSMKDLPGEMPEGLTLAAIPVREDARDVLIGRTAPTLASLPAGAIIGTSSLRRRVQLQYMRPDLQIRDLRGNIDTRLAKLQQGQYDAICLAAAGLHRLNLADNITEYFAPDVLLSAVGQGALAIQTRADDALIRSLACLHDAHTALAISAERAVLAGIGGGCAVPLGALANWHGNQFLLTASLWAPNGSSHVTITAPFTDDAETIGYRVAQQLLQGASEKGFSI